MPGEPRDALQGRLRLVLQRCLRGEDDRPDSPRRGKGILIPDNNLTIGEISETPEDCLDCDEEVETMMQEQIENIEQEQGRLQQLVNKEKKSRGLFGWIRSWFGR